MNKIYLMILKLFSKKENPHYFKMTPLTGDQINILMDKAVKKYNKEHSTHLFEDDF